MLVCDQVKSRLYKYGTHLTPDLAGGQRYAAVLTSFQAETFRRRGFPIERAGKVHQVTFTPRAAPQSS